MLTSVRDRVLGTLLVALGDTSKVKVFGQAYYVLEGVGRCREQCDHWLAGVCVDYWTVLDQNVKDQTWEAYLAIIRKVEGK